MKRMADNTNKLILNLDKTIKQLSRKVDNGFRAVDKRFEQVDDKFEELEIRIGRGFADVQDQINNLATKDGLRRVANDVSDVRRRLMDLERDTPTKQEFDELRRRTLVS